MIGATIGIAVLFALIALTRRQPGAALGILVLSMLLWPEYLRVPLGLVQMSVPRFVAIMLLIKFLARGRHRQIDFGKVDVLVILIWIWTVLANIAAGADFPQVSQMIGRGLDTVLMYFVARMALVAPTDARDLYWGLGVTALVMCAVGVFEAVTWQSPYEKLLGGSGVTDRIYGYEQIRYGMLRALASTGVSIYFGMAMTLVTGLLWAIRGYVRRRLIYGVFIGAAVIATLSSLSSGPWLALSAVIGMNMYYLRPSLIKPSLYALLLMAIALEIASNRHFYNLIDYLALDPLTAWYRTRLLEVAVAQWRDYWLFGVGSAWPHAWGEMVDGRAFIDVVNHFLIVALYGGLPAMFMYLAMHVVAIKQVVHAFQGNGDLSLRKLLFGLTALLAAIDFSSMSVGLFGPALLLSHILLGAMVSAATSRVPQAVTRRDETLSRLGVDNVGYDARARDRWA